MEEDNNNSFTLINKGNGKSPGRSEELWNYSSQASQNYIYIILNKYVVGWSNKIRAHTNYYINK